METIAIADKTVKLAGARCIVSIASLGLVSQLACDLLLGSAEFERIAHLTSAFHVPVVGAVDTVSQKQAVTGISTPIELYYSSLHSLALVHQRAPPLKSQKGAFVSALVAWLQKQQFSAILLLGSMDAATRRDVDLSSAALRHLTFSEKELPLADRVRHTYARHQNADANGATEAIPLIPAGGLMRRLVTALAEVPSLDGGALLLYVVEGDNREDASILAKAALEVLDISASVDKQPRSWQAGLYGSSQPQELFG